MSSGGGSGSLRDLYSDPPITWSFITPPPNNSGPLAGASTRVEPAPTYQWSTRPRTNSIYELSPDLSFEPSTPNAVAFLRTAAASVILQYFSAAVENPFEVGKTLLQVQYVPRNTVAIKDLDPSIEEEDEASDESSSADNEDSYFADEAESSSRMNTPRPTDDRGYVVRQNVSDTETRPDWIIPPGSVSGVWPMIKQVGRWKPEGWFALWKGTATGCVKSFLESSLQPIVHSTLTQAFTTITVAPSSAVFSRAHPLLLPVASSLLTGFILSPLDLIRTRLIVQTSVTQYRRYSGPFDALDKILLHEGGLRSLYLHPQLLYPTLLDCMIRPLVSAIAPAFVGRFLSKIIRTHISEDSHPLLWAIAQLGGACVSLLITLPIETIRRRLQVQTRGAAQSIPSCVEVRRKPYAGIVDVLYSILVEERSDLPLRPRRRERSALRVDDKGKGREHVDQVVEHGQESWLRNTGIGQLYRGLGMNIGASVIIFLLSMLTSEPNEGSGWTEL